LKRPLFSSDVGVQTEVIAGGAGSPTHTYKMDVQDDQESTLSAADLASILKWSKDISSDINLSSGLSVYLSVVAHLTGGLGVALQRLTEIAAGNSFVLSLSVDF
jgi:hypothetical protein